MAGALPRFAGEPAPTGTAFALNRARTLWGAFAREWAAARP